MQVLRDYPARTTSTSERSCVLTNLLHRSLNLRFKLYTTRINKIHVFLQYRMCRFPTLEVVVFDLEHGVSRDILFCLAMIDVDMHELGMRPKLET